MAIILYPSGLEMDRGIYVTLEARVVLPPGGYGGPEHILHPRDAQGEHPRFPQWGGDRGEDGDDHPQCPEGEGVSVYISQGPHTASILRSRCGRGPRC